MQEYAAEADRGAVHEHELAGHRDRPLLLQRAVNDKGLAAPVFRRRDPVGDGAHPVIEERPVDEPRPDVERVDEFA